jgi:hypothetical protein
MRMTEHGESSFKIVRVETAGHEVPIARELGAASDVPPGHNGLDAPGGLPVATKTALERHCADAVKSEVVRQIITTGQSIRL